MVIIQNPFLFVAPWLSIACSSGQTCHLQL